MAVILSSLDPSSTGHFLLDATQWGTSGLLFTTCYYDDDDDDEIKKHVMGKPVAGIVRIRNA